MLELSDQKGRGRDARKEGRKADWKERRVRGTEGGREGGKSHMFMLNVKSGLFQARWPQGFRT